MTFEDESVRDVSQRLGDPLATVMATHSEAHAADAQAYLREQTRLARLQSENLIEQNAFEISHLRWRRVGDRVRGVGYVIMVLFGLAVVAAAAAAVWSAARDHRLVIESFSVPPGLTEQGQTGAVVAQHVLDRIVAMEAGTQSLRAAKSYRNNWGDDLKVQIPDTGISLGEAYRFLVGWLGRETHITGEVVRDGQGYAVTARAGAGAGITVRGDNLDDLLDSASERLFGATQPYRYGIYLSSHGREAESKSVLLALAQGDAPASERAWAYSGLLFVENDTRRAEKYGFAAIGLNPHLLLAHNNLASVAWRLGHSEFAYQEAVAGLKLLNDDGDVQLDPGVLGNMHSVLAEFVDASLGDFDSGVREMQADLTVDHTSVRPRSQAYLIYDLAQMHDAAAARRVAIDAQPQASRTQANRQTILAVLAKAHLDMESRDWDAARTELSSGVAALGPDYAAYQLQAPLAYVLAKRGDVGAARTLAAKLPSDCYPCVIARASVEVVAGDNRYAASLFAQAAQLGPSLPFAWTDWGEMLLRESDYDSAIAKFAVANQKSAHFADPLELWGEALMQENRSDLALAKFEEANKYAPDWGRLHLEWGKALFCAGRRGEAEKQFAIASPLDLSHADRLSLAQWMKHRG
jgi:tetratricopeptide (TPR) repeat protein